MRKLKTKSINTNNINTNNLPCLDCARDLGDDIRRLRDRCGNFVNNKHVETAVLVLIVLNAIMMGIGTFDFVTENQKVFNTFEIIDSAFLYIFTAELLLQFIYHGFYIFTNPWLVFDFIIIVTSFTLRKAQIIRAFRVLRTLRLVSRVEAMKEVIGCLFAIMPRMLAIVSFLSLIMYIFSVVFTTLFRETFELNVTEYNYFGSLESSALTLFQMMTLDGWSHVCRQIMEVYRWAWIPFIVYVIITAFIVVNLVIAVICDAIADVNTMREERRVSQINMLRSSFIEEKELHEYVSELEARQSSLIESQAQTQMMIDELSKIYLPRSKLDSRF